MNATTYHYDATGERIEDDLAPEQKCSPAANATPAVTRRDPEIVARCNELRRILAEARARRQAAA